MKRIFFAVFIAVIVAASAASAAYEGAVYFTDNKITVETNDPSLISVLVKKNWIEIARTQGYVARDVSVFRSAKEILVYPINEDIRQRYKTVKYAQESQYLPSVLAILDRIEMLKERPKNK